MSTLSGLVQRRSARALAALLLVAVLCGLAGTAAQARELLVVGAQFARVFERADDGNFAGMGPEIVRTLAARMGHTVRFEIYPWARAQAMVAQGKADILVGPYKSPARLELLAFSARPFYQDHMVFFARAGARPGWAGDYAALTGLRIVALNGWVYGADFDRARPILQISTANTVENGVRMLVHEHVDLFATNQRNTEPVVAALGMQQKVAPLAQVIDVQNGYFAFPKGMQHDSLRAAFDLAFNAYVGAGELRKLGRRLEVEIP